MRVFLTGATGFLGSFTARALLARGHEVTALVRPGSGTWRIADIRDRLTLAEGSLDAPDALAKSLNVAKPDVVVHLAWSGVGNTARNDIAQFDNVAATLRLAQAAAEAGAQSLVATGSQAEYGPVNAKLDERAPLNPTTLYGAAKVAAWHGLNTVCEAADMRLAWLRVFSTYGPMDNEGWLISSLIAKLRAGERPSLTGCEQLWDFLYVEDAAEAIAAAAETRDVSGAFNLGSGIAPPLLETVTALRDIVAPDAELGVGEVPYRHDQVMHLEADISKLSAATGWTPATPLKDGLARTAAWYDDSDA